MFMTTFYRYEARRRILNEHGDFNVVDRRKDDDLVRVSVYIITHFFNAKCSAPGPIS